MALDNKSTRCATLPKALRTIFAKFGTEVLTGERTLYSMLLDYLSGYSPENKRSLNLTQNAMELGILQRIYDGIGKDTHTQVTTLATCKKLLVDNCGTADTTAEEFVYAFGTALDWKLPAPAKNQAPPAPPPVTVSKPAPPPVQTPPTSQYRSPTSPPSPAPVRPKTVQEICELADSYRTGDGVTQSYTEAARLYRIAAEQGHFMGQYNLGICYEMGDGVPKNDTEAVKWCRLAADQGYTGALKRMGYYYENGIGVPKSLVEAVRWYKAAVDKGDESSGLAMTRVLVAFAKEGRQNGHI